MGRERVSVLRGVSAIVNRGEYVAVMGRSETSSMTNRPSGEEIMMNFDRLNGVGLAIVLVTHEEQVARHRERIVRLRDGVINEDRSISKPEVGTTL